MNDLRSFLVPFKSRKDGVHNFDFEVDNSFFKALSPEEPIKGSFEVNMMMDKRSDMLVFEFDFKGTINTNCDRCLAGVHLPIEGTNSIIVKFADDKEEEASVSYIPHESTDINVAKFIYEFILLAIPIKQVYECEDELPRPCDLKMLDYLSGDQEGENENNPMWDALKNFNRN